MTECACISPGYDPHSVPPTAESTFRNLDMPTRAKIIANKELPPEWEHNSLLKTAHRIYWAEYDKEKKK